MPELPEVETICNGLRKVIVGQTITAVEVLDEKRWQADESDIIKSKIVDVRRRAKNIIIDFANGQSLYIHLKMTGQLIFRDQSSVISHWEKQSDNGQLVADNQIAGGHPSKDWWAELPNKYTRVIFHFEDGSRLYFNDLRRFGWIRSSKTVDLAAKHLNEYGIEPLTEAFTKKALNNVIRKRPKSNIKKLLTDQSFIAGIGNIYADEALFDAGILPTRLVATIKVSEIKLLHCSIIKVLELGLKHGGASNSDYVDSEGKRGQMQDHFQVYGRKGESCKMKGCSGIIEKIRLNGRGTHFCKECQK